jgi:hypothetical protein
MRKVWAEGVATLFRSFVGVDAYVKPREEAP